MKVFDIFLQRQWETAPQVSRGSFCLLRVVKEDQEFRRTRVSFLEVIGNEKCKIAKPFRWKDKSACHKANFRPVIRPNYVVGLSRPEMQNVTHVAKYRRRECG